MWQRIKNIYHLLVAIGANVYYGFAARKLTVIGITGTDGKTTTASLVYHILHTAGKQASLISTVGAYIGGTTYDTGFHVTNPSSIALQKFLRKIVDLGKEAKENYVVLEVTSHGIDQNRIWGIPFAIAGLTNITHEHLDYHKTYENYLYTKTKLLKKAAMAVINKDDDSYTKVSQLLEGKKYITYGVHHSADITTKTLSFHSLLPGQYNVYNCLLAIGICRYLGIADEDIQKGTASFTPPIGRMEVVYNKEFTVMVDFAHTPNALEQILSTVKPTVKGRLIHVFGSAGKRDASKRPFMGKIAATYDDVIILTAEDPRSEKVEKINAQIKKGMEKYNKLFEISNRKDAIQKSVSIAKKGDFIIITGKGPEGSMNYDGKHEVPWSDTEAVKTALNKRINE